jgi:TonB family protein
VFPVALALSAAVHAAAMGLPRFETETWAKPVPGAMQLIDPLELQPLTAETRLPPRVARPAVPEPPPAIGLGEFVPDPAGAEVEVALVPVFEVPELPASVTDALAQRAEFMRYQSLMPTMVAPELENRSRIQREFERRIPYSLLHGRKAGQVRLLLWIDEQGTVRKHELRHTTGSRSLEQTVEALVALLKFRPTHWHGRPIASVVELPFTFQVF